MAGDPYALRLDTARASAMAGPLTWTDRMRGRQLCRPDVLGDVVIARKELPTSYHLAVVVDDAAQGVTEVTRGEDLLEATHVHRLLYAVLGLPEPAWHHHPLCRDAAGRRLAKRAEDVSIAALRDAGHGPDQVLAMASAAAAWGGVGDPNATLSIAPLSLSPYGSDKSPRDRASASGA